MLYDFGVVEEKECKCHGQLVAFSSFTSSLRRAHTTSQQQQAQLDAWSPSPAKAVSYCSLEARGGSKACLQRNQLGTAGTVLPFVTGSCKVWEAGRPCSARRRARAKLLEVTRKREKRHGQVTLPARAQGLWDLGGAESVMGITDGKSNLMTFGRVSSARRCKPVVWLVHTGAGTGTGTGRMCQLQASHQHGQARTLELQRERAQKAGESYKQGFAKLQAGQSLLCPEKIVQLQRARLLAWAPSR